MSGVFQCWRPDPGNTQQLLEIGECFVGNGDGEGAYVHGALGGCHIAVQDTSNCLQTMGCLSWSIGIVPEATSLLSSHVGLLDLGVERGSAFVPSVVPKARIVEGIVYWPV